MEVASSSETMQPLTKLQWYNQKTTILIYTAVEIKNAQTYTYLTIGFILVHMLFKKLLKYRQLMKQKPF
jgi:hypothetical protein